MCTTYTELRTPYQREGEATDEGDRPGPVRLGGGPRSAATSSKPRIGDDEVLVRVHAASIHVGDWILMTGSPFVMRMATGLRKPKNPVPGTDIAGTVEAVGKDVQRLRAGRRGVRRGAPAHSPSTRRRARTSSCRSRPTSPSSRRPPSACRRPPPCSCCATTAKVQPGPEGPDQRRIGRRRHVRGADRQGVRCRGDRRVQHEERGPGPLHRRRPRHRLHAARTSPRACERYDLILDNVGNHSMAQTRRALTPDGTLISNGGGHAGGKLGRTIRAHGRLDVRAPAGAARRSRPRTTTTSSP